MNVASAYDTASGAASGGIVWTTAFSIRLRSTFTKKNALFRAIGPPTLKPNVFRPASGFGSLGSRNGSLARRLSSSK